MGQVVRFLIIATFALVATQTLAHRPGERYLYINAGEASLSGRVEITLQDLLGVPGLDANGDGWIEQSEFEASAQSVQDLVQRSFSFEVDGEHFGMKLGQYDYLDVGFATFVRFPFDTDVSKQLPDLVQITKHPTLVKEAAEGSAETPTLVLVESNVRTGLHDNEARHQFVFDPGLDMRNLNLAGDSSGVTFSSFFGFGIHHFLFGLDYLGFVLALLLPTVLLRREDAWQPQEALRPVIGNVVTLVVLFTLAYTVSLALVTVGGLHINPTFVTASLAASIVVVAACNLMAATSRWVHVLVVAFGLVHGLGFAGNLAPYGIEAQHLFTSLFAFGLGLELGLIVMVGLCLPLLFLLRKSRLYVPVVLWGGSLGLMAIGGMWFVERAFGIPLSVRDILL